MVNSDMLRIGPYSNNIAQVRYLDRLAGNIERHPNKPDYFFAQVRERYNAEEEKWKRLGHFGSENEAKEAIAKNFDLNLNSSMPGDADNYKMR